jgi:3',5'-cyclic-AMP phosphodiesterase
MPTQPYPEVRVVQITDAHLLQDPRHTLRGHCTERSLRRVLAHILAHEMPADLLLASGDLAHDAPAGTYARLRRHLLGTALPTLCLPGNHDDRTAMAQTLAGERIAYLETIDVAGWRIIALDSVIPGCTAGRLVPAELARLEAGLRARPDCHALICLHHPPVPTGSQRMDAIGLENGPDLFTVLDRFRHVRGIVWGHVHGAFDAERQGVRLMATPSTCFQFELGEEITIGNAPPGYRWITLLPGGGIRTGIVVVPDDRV